jgi:hypothetical protein
VFDFPGAAAWWTVAPGDLPFFLLSTLHITQILNRQYWQVQAVQGIQHTSQGGLIEQLAVQRGHHRLVPPGLIG